MELIINGKSIKVPRDGFYPQIIVTADPTAVITINDGEEVIPGTSVDGTTTFDIPRYGTWTVEAMSGESSESQTVVVDSVKQYSVTFETSHIYGVEWSDTTTTKLTRTDDAVTFVDPVAAVGDSEGSSPFDNLMPWSGMVRVNDDTVGTLVAIPKYWLKVSHNPFKVRISDKELPGFQVSPAHRDRGDGQGERDVVYIGRYECDSTYQSWGNTTPLNNKNITTFRSNIHALGADIWQCDFAIQLTLWYLYLVEFADWNSRKVIGPGNISTDVINITGDTNSMSYHTGRAPGTKEETSIQYRNIENLWGNVGENRDGIIFSDENISTYNNPADFVSGYNETGATIRSNKRSTTSGAYIGKWGYDENDPSFIYPSEVVGDGSIPNYCTYSDGIRILRVSGGFSTGTNAGLFFLSGGASPSSTSPQIGSRLMKLPNKT